MHGFRKVINRLWYPKILAVMFFLVVYILSTEAFYKIVWVDNSPKIGKIECVNIYAVGRPLMGTETLIVAAGKYVPDDRISVVTDDPIGRKAEVEEFFMRGREITFTTLNTIKAGPSRDRCLWLYSPESACEVSAFNPRSTFLRKSGILIYFPAAQDLEINTKTITKCLKTLSSN